MNAHPVALLLASASPARTKLLADAGIRHSVVVSDVDEEAATAAAGPMDARETALLLARAKAEAVAALPASAGSLVLGCDSVFEFDGVPYGKPWEPQIARERWLAMAGRSGTLHTGHWLADRRPGADDGGRGGRGEVTSAVVRFEDVSEAEIDAYVATGEPLAVAGGFTLDGRGGAFISGVEGDPHTVIGLSISTLRRLLGGHGVPLTDLWD